MTVRVGVSLPVVARTHVSTLPPYERRFRILRIALVSKASQRGPHPGRAVRGVCAARVLRAAVVRQVENRIARQHRAGSARDGGQGRIQSVDAARARVGFFARRSRTRPYAAAVRDAGRRSVGGNAVEMGTGVRRNTTGSAKARTFAARRRHLQRPGPGRARARTAEGTDAGILDQQHRDRGRHAHAGRPAIQAIRRGDTTRHRHSIPVEPALRRADSRDAETGRRDRRREVQAGRQYDALRRHQGSDARAQPRPLVAATLCRVRPAAIGPEAHRRRANNPPHFRLRHGKRCTARADADRNRAARSAGHRAQRQLPACRGEGYRGRARQGRPAGSIDRVASGCGRRRRSGCAPLSRRGHRIRPPARRADDRGQGR